MEVLPTVLVVEDDSFVRRLFEKSVQQHDRLSLYGSVENFRDAERALAGKPDVMLVDLGLPDGNGAELIRMLKQRSPHSEAIVITVFADEFRVVEAIKAGATGYLLKDSMPDDIGDLIVQMLAGDAPISSSIARHILKMFNAAPAPAPEQAETEILSSRELEVLQLVARGYNREEIARLMDLSIHTVVSHIRHIYEKLEVHSRNEAVFEACQMGLIKLNE